MCATANPPARDAIRPGSVGLPICDTEVMITQVATGEPLPPNQEGEVAIRGPQLLAGYWNKPEETAKVLREGWLFTGDIGRMDDDGYLYITDRKKDMIIYKGYNVCPRKLEEILFQHPAVEQCAVVGKPDINAGEAPAAFVQLRSEMECSLEEVMERADSQVAHYKKIREIIVVDQIPVSAAGKVLKRELGERLRQTA
jgi:long-chain acyl-CoA synthetase